MSFALRRLLVGFFVLGLLPDWIASAADPAAPTIRALLITGGCCHDYAEQKKILTEGISARAPVEWTIEYSDRTTTDIKFPIYEKPDWSKGFDVVVHNECVSDVTDLDWIERILKPHREGLPAVVIHCAMHCYRGKTDDWYKFVGVSSNHHGPHTPFEVVNLDPRSPIMKGFGEKWQTPAGELYILDKVWPTAKPLAHAMSVETKNNEVCIWTNQFEKGRVFGTTVGHFNSEMSDPIFLNYVTRGLLWAVDKLDDKHFKPVAAAPVPAPAGKSSASARPRSSSQAVALAAATPAPQHPAAKPSSEVVEPDQNRDPPELVAIEAEGLLAGIKAPAGFEVTLFAAPPDVTYPTCLAAAPTGEVYIAIDENGSIDTEANRGRVVRAVDSDGDGRADQFNVFARMDSPRGLHFDHGTLYVMHPPQLSAYHDDDGDGVADRSEVLVEGLGFDLKTRGADHTTNGIRLAIDGWLYLATGDYGIYMAVGKDGRQLTMQGGGVIRVRPDGTELEAVGRGQRNIYDVAVDPLLNAFIRDNSNDGGGWNVRLSQVIQGGQYGYPSLFQNFSDEVIAPLADLGVGAPTGALCVDEPGLPGPLGHALYTCEWGCNAVFWHPLTPQGAGFIAEQKTFLELPRPTDIDVDGASRLYVSTWREGSYHHTLPDIGYVIRVSDPSSPAETFPAIEQLDDRALLRELVSSSQVRRLTVQREILRRGERPGVAAELERLALAPGVLSARVAAIFTLKQLLGSQSHEALARIAKTDELREFAIHALADRTTQSAGVPVSLFTAALKDSNPRVRLQAVIGLGRLGHVETARALVPLLADADPLVAHATVHTLTTLGATAVCLAALDKALATIGRVATTENSSTDESNDLSGIATKISFTQPAAEMPADADRAARLAAGCVRVLQAQHDKTVVDGLVERLTAARTAAERKPLLTALCRLYYREADWNGEWWRPRPDTTGPYYAPVRWPQSDRIGSVLNDALEHSDRRLAGWLLCEMDRHQIGSLAAVTTVLRLAPGDPSVWAVAVRVLAAGQPVPDEAVALLGDVASSDDDSTATRALAFRTLVRICDRPSALDAALRTLVALTEANTWDAEWLRLRDEMVRELRVADQAKVLVEMADGADPVGRQVAYLLLIGMAHCDALPEQVRQTAAGVVEQAWSRLDRSLDLLWAIGIARDDRFAYEVSSRLKDNSPRLRKAAEFAAHKMHLEQLNPSADGTIAKLKFDDVVSQTINDPGDPDRGAQLFARQGCATCHTVSRSEALKGPFLGGVAERYSRPELIESIVKPSAKIAQGFETQHFVLETGKVVDGFVVRESGVEIELRGATGQVTVLYKRRIEERGRRELSMMPNGLVDALTCQDLASILAYLESLQAK